MTPRAEISAEAAAAAGFTSRQMRALKIAVVVMGVILIAGFAVLLGAIVYQASQLAESGAGPGALAPVADLAVAAGQTVQAVALDGERLAVHLAGPRGAEIAIVDLRSGETVSRVRLKVE